MNVFASEKKSARKSPLEPSKKGGLDASSRAPSNSELLGSQITPVSAPSKGKDGSLSAGGLTPMSKSGASLLGGPIQAKKPPKVSAPVSQDTERIVTKKKGSTTDMTFMTTQSRALYEMVENATPEQLRTDTTLRQMILDDYKMNMAARLQNYEGDDYQHMFSSVFRANDIGELDTYNKLLKASLPEGMIEQMSQINDGTEGSIESSLDFAGQQLMNDPLMQEILMAGMDGFGDSKHFSGENSGNRSEMLMNNVMLRSIAPQFTQKAIADRNAYADAHMTPDGGKKMHDDLFDEGVAQGVGKKDVKLSVDLQKAVKEGGTSEGGNRFKGLLTAPWKTARPEYGVSFGSSAPGYGEKGDVGKFWASMNSSKGKAPVSSERAGLYEYLKQRFADKGKYGDALTQNLQNASGSEDVAGLNLSRLIGPLVGALGGSMTNEEIGDMYEKLMQGGHYAELRRNISAAKSTITAKAAIGEDTTALEEKLSQMESQMQSYTPQQVADMDEKTNEGKMQLKGIYFDQLKRLRDKYGRLGSQMHPEDFLSKVGPEFFDEMSLLQDCEQMMKSSPQSFDYESNEDDREFKTLADYYNDLYGVMNIYSTGGFNPEPGTGFAPTDFGMEFLNTSEELRRMLKNEAGIIGPSMDDEQLDAYVERLQKRMMKGKGVSRMFGRFKK